MSKVWFVTGANSGIGAGIAKAAFEGGGPGRRDRPEPR
jgi:NAD(P)-dependent dehydrogenase (short-subunit alcohol dehydrogenase family)